MEDSLHIDAGREHILHSTSKESNNGGRTEYLAVSAMMSERRQPHYGFSHQFAGRAKLLRPQLRADLIERERLYPHTSSAFVLIVGPAGAGKTTLVSQWLVRENLPSTWLTLDAEDNNLSSFVRHVVAAIQRVAPDVGHAALGALRMPERPPSEMIGGMLADDLHTLSRDIIVVLDDFHEISSADVLRLMAPLLRYPAPHVRFVLVSRAVPGLPLARLQARGDLEEIRAEDLRFTAAESHHLLFNLVGRSISDDALSSLVEQNEGWAVGLLFAGLAMRESGDPDRLAEALRVNGEPRSLDFLFEEVLSHLPITVQEFLLRTSCVDAFTVSLCDALTWEPDGHVDSTDVLSWLANRNLYLIPLDGDEGWFRYHHVFRLLLSQQLRRRHGVEMVHRLLTRARDWYDEHDFADEAVRYSLEADEPLVAGEIVKRRAQATLVDGNWPVLETWLRALPKSMVDRDSELLMLSGWCAWLRGRGTDAARLTMQSRARLVDVEQPERTVEGVQAELDCIDICRRWIIDDPALQVQTLERVIPKLPVDHHFALGQSIFRLATARVASGNWNTALRALHALVDKPTRKDYVTQFAITSMIWIYSFSGDITKASTLADRLLRAVSDSSTSAFAVGWAHWLAGTVAYERNDLVRAATMLQTAVWHRDSIPFITFQDSILLLAATYQTTGRSNEADALLDDLLSLAESVNFVAALESARAYAALFAFQQGRLQIAYRWLDRAAHDPPSSPPMFSLPIHLILARLLIARGTPSDLERASRAIYLIERRYHGTVIAERRSLQIRVLRSLLEERLGNQLMANEFMREAMELVRPDGFFRSLIDFGPSIAPLLQRLPTSPLTERLVDALNDESSHPERVTNQTAPVDVITSETALPPIPNFIQKDALTSRELEVLKLLKARLSNREIAEELFISPLTVKRHNSNIFDKLGVSGRRWAVRRAEEIGILPADEPASDGSVH